MQPLFELLSGITCSTDERYLIDAVKKKVMEEVELALTCKLVNRMNTFAGVQLFIFKEQNTMWNIVSMA